jgi:hypothetical protein
MSAVPTKKRKPNISIQSNAKSKDFAPVRPVKVVPEPAPVNRNVESRSEISDNSSQPGGDSEYNEDGRSAASRSITQDSPTMKPAEPAKTFKDLVSTVNPLQIGYS